MRISEVTASAGNVETPVRAFGTAGANSRSDCWPGDPFPEDRKFRVPSALLRGDGSDQSPSARRVRAASANSSGNSTQPSWRASSPRSFRALRLRGRPRQRQFRSPLISTKTSPRCQRQRLERHPETRRFQISAAHSGPNLLHQNGTASWLISMPRSCSRSSMLRRHNGKRMYIITARRLISSEVLNYRNGERWTMVDGYATALPASRI